MVEVLIASRHKICRELSALGAVEETVRLQLAVQSAAHVVFDWDVAAGTISWDGALEILPFRDRGRAQNFIDNIAQDKRGPIETVLDTRSSQPSDFHMDMEVASAMGAIVFTMDGTRIPGENGGAARLIGIMRDTTERTREVQRLTYLATRDELTGHLNRNALREELAQAIERAKEEKRHCAFLVASIDRLAMINDSFGFGAGEEVIVGVGERLARALRGSDVIGRTAGNKFGVLLKNCQEAEIDIVAARLKRAVRDNARGNRRAARSRPPARSGAVWLPHAAGSSQDAMLRAEQALDQRPRQRPRRLCDL